MKNRLATPNEEQQAPAKKSRGRFSRLVTNVLSGEFLTKESVTAHLPFVLYVCAFFLLSIYIGYVFENTEREKIRVERQLQELSAEYKTLKSELEAKKQQSSVAQAISSLGLVEPTAPPVIIEFDAKSIEE
ncbi:FtsL-like putative cell division protein [Sanyastnella coralliicola]|uniref:FtsL-like putative cell division protein n=1 Tax=Sanyastnella coralliicola TaxID=3069118 RepID=UPI0027B96058|nr:FtsL-like putative cell division protein [Longitalea sp. SCSIO 12813]